MRRQKINWFFSTSESCSVASPSLSGDEAQNYLPVHGAQVNLAAKGAHGAPSATLQVVRTRRQGLASVTVPPPRLRVPQCPSVSLNRTVLHCPPTL